VQSCWFAYDYDAAGNRTQEDRDGTPLYYYYDEANELTEKQQGGTWTYYAYDENGSMLREFDQTAGTTTYYEYADNGLVSSMKPAGENATYFHYDARMQRYAIDFAGTLAYFAWDGLNQLEERGDDLSLTARHTHGYTPIEGIGSVIVTKRSSDYQYPSYDHRGSLFNLEDTGAADLEAQYDAFGEELRRSGSAVARFGYQGTAWMRHDSGLYVSPTRAYVPGVGRFGQQDLLPGPQNAYALLGYQHVAGVDPTGLFPACVPVLQRGPDYEVDDQEWRLRLRTSAGLHATLKGEYDVTFLPYGSRGEFSIKVEFFWAHIEDGSSMVLTLQQLAERWKVAEVHRRLRINCRRVKDNRCEASYTKEGSPVDDKLKIPGHIGGVRAEIKFLYLEATNDIVEANVRARARAEMTQEGRWGGSASKQLVDYAASYLWRCICVDRPELPPDPTGGIYLA
jgi:RHS repeat-associated protein